MLKTIVGGTLGFAAGALLGAGRAAVTLMAPALWVPGNALTLGVIAYSASDGNVPVTVASAVAGGCLGVVEVACYPVTAPVSLALAAACPLIGTVAGGVVGYHS